MMYYLIIFRSESGSNSEDEEEAEDSKIKEQLNDMKNEQNKDEKKFNTFKYLSWFYYRIKINSDIN